MVTYLDTNYLVRFFTQDIKSQALKAKKVIEEENIFISDIVLAETVFILKTHYQVKKAKLCLALSSLISQPNIITSRHAPKAVIVYQNENISFYDCLLLAEVVNAGSKLKTFDQKLAKVIHRYKKN